MPQKDDEAAELKHAEEVGFVIFPAADQAAEIVKPSEEAFDFPAATATAQFAVVLGALPGTVEFVRGD